MDSSLIPGGRGFLQTVDSQWNLGPWVSWSPPAEARSDWNKIVPKIFDASTPGKFWLYHKNQIILTVINPIYFGLYQFLDVGIQFNPIFFFSKTIYHCFRAFAQIPKSDPRDLWSRWAKVMYQYQQKNARSQQTRKVVVVVVFFLFWRARWIKDLNQKSPVMSVIALGSRNQDLACRNQSEEAGWGRLLGYIR